MAKDKNPYELINA